MSKMLSTYMQHMAFIAKWDMVLLNEKNCSLSAVMLDFLSTVFNYLSYLSVIISFSTENIYIDKIKLETLFHNLWNTCNYIIFCIV